MDIKALERCLNLESARSSFGTELTHPEVVYGQMVRLGNDIGDLPLLSLEAVLIGKYFKAIAEEFIVNDKENLHALLDVFIDSLD